MRNTTILLAVVAVMAMAAPAWGQSSEWNVAGPASWDVGGNWIGGVPNSGRDVKIYNGGTCQLQSGTNASAYAAYIGGALGGELQVLPGSTLEIAVDLFAGYNAGTDKDAKYIQSGGTVTIGRYVEIGFGWDNGSTDLLSISGGSFTANKLFQISRWSPGTFEVIGGNADITLGDGYKHYSSNAILRAEVNASGLTTVAVTGTATFDGTFTVLDDGAATGTYTLMTYTSKSGSFATTNMPSSDWSYDLGDTSLTVTKVPEPATMVLLGIGGIGVLLRRRKR